MASDYTCHTQSLANLIYPLGWKGSVAELRDAIEAVRAVAYGKTESFALGGNGPFDLLIYPGSEEKARFTIFPNIDQGRRLEDLTVEVAESLNSLVGDSGFGPESGQSLIDWVQHLFAKVKEYGRPMTTAFAGMFMMVVKPNGSYLIVPEMYQTTYEIG